MDKTLQQALSQLRALEAAGEDPRNANQRWDVTPEQAGALLAHLDDVEQKLAETGGAVLTREQLEHEIARISDPVLRQFVSAVYRRIAELEQRHAAAVAERAEAEAHARRYMYLRAKTSPHGFWVSRGSHDLGVSLWNSVELDVALDNEMGSCRSIAASESGWVIEGSWSDPSTPDYWVGSSAWSQDSYKALRFARQQDAQQAADLMCAGLNVRIAEHEWAPAQEASDGK